MLLKQSLNPAPWVSISSLLFHLNSMYCIGTTLLSGFIYFGNKYASRILYSNLKTVTEVMEQLYNICIQKIYRKCTLKRKIFSHMKCPVYVCLWIRSGDSEWHEGHAGGASEGERETAGQEGAIQRTAAVCFYCHSSDLIFLFLLRNRRTENIALYNLLLMLLSFIAN